MSSYLSLSVCRQWIHQQSIKTPSLFEISSQAISDLPQRTPSPKNTLGASNLQNHGGPRSWPRGWGLGVESCRPTATLSGIQHVRYSWRALTVSGALLQNIESLPTIIVERSIQVPWYSDTTPLNGRRNQLPTPKATINSRQKYIISSMPLIRINNHFTKNVF